MPFSPAVIGGNMFQIIRLEEVHTKLVAIEADTPEEAEKIAERLYSDGVIDADGDLSFTAKAEGNTVATYIGAISAAYEVIAKETIKNWE